MRYERSSKLFADANLTIPGGVILPLELLNL